MLLCAFCDRYAKYEIRKKNYDFLAAVCKWHTSTPEYSWAEVVVFSFLEEEQVTIWTVE